MEFPDPRQLPFAPIHTRGELPHLYKPGAFYFLTFRLFDAVLPPQSRSSPRPSEEIDPAAIAASHDPPITLGSCSLRIPEIARLVQNALLHFEGQRYSLIAWCVMPNHVHAVLYPLAPHTPSQILHSWKSFTANQANRALGRSGPFWERESFDHLVRSEAHLNGFIEYTNNNPVNAGLCAQPHNWPYSSAGIGFLPQIHAPEQL